VVSDPFEHDDGAYVLGALSPADRAAFEAHLESCTSCAARVAELRDLPRLLAGITPEELADPGPVPDTLLPRLVREVRATRRRRALIAGAGALVAACAAVVLAVILTVVATRPAGHPSPAAAGRPMQQLVPTPVHARVALAAQPWGTRITLHCRYDEAGGAPFAYRMVAIDRDHGRYVLGGWQIKGGQNITYVAGAPVTPKDIAAVLVTTVNGTPILRLRT
jgi:hypothetical protein